VSADLERADDLLDVPAERTVLSDLRHTGPALADGGARRAAEMD
jgi:hypothetical protein